MEVTEASNQTVIKARGKQITLQYLKHNKKGDAQTGEPTLHIPFSVLDVVGEGEAWAFQRSTYAKP